MIANKVTGESKYCWLVATLTLCVFCAILFPTFSFIYTVIWLIKVIIVIFDTIC